MIAPAIFLINADRNSVASTALVSGALLVGMGSLTPWLRRVGWGKAALDIEDPEIQRARFEEEKAFTSREIADETTLGGQAVDTEETIDVARYFVATLAINAILSNAKEAYPYLEDCEFRLYMYSDRLKELIPVLDLGGAEEAQQQRGWKPGEGATGAAYITGQHQIADWNATHDGTFNLDEEDQRRYAHLTEVSAMPVINAIGTTIGVLTASHSTGQEILTTNEGREALKTAADSMARLVIDLLGWRNDTALYDAGRHSAGV